MGADVVNNLRNIHDDPADRCSSEFGNSAILDVCNRNTVDDVHYKWWVLERLEGRKYMGGRMCPKSRRSFEVEENFAVLPPRKECNPSNGPDHEVCMR
jgi:hypothetical protein